MSLTTAPSIALVGRISLAAVPFPAPPIGPSLMPICTSHTSHLHPLVLAQTMLLHLLVSMALAWRAVLSSLVSVARNGPDSKIKLSPAPSLPQSLSQPIPPVSAAVASSAWIKDYLLFYSKKPEIHSLQVEAKPRRTKITNYGSRLSNENDLSSFTRHLVELLREEFEPKKKKPKNVKQPPVVDLDIDHFITYLVEHKGFTERQLAFLRRPQLDYGYDTIEKELTLIRRQQTDQKHISIGGESTGSIIETSNFLTAFLALSLWL